MRHGSEVARRPIAWREPALAHANPAGRNAARCAAVEEAVAVLRRRWKPSVLWLMASGCRRYTELAMRLPGVSPKVLSQHLRELERGGLVTRHVAPRGRKHVEYRLTDAGNALRPVLEQLEEWGRTHVLERGKHRGHSTRVEASHLVRTGSAGG